MDEKVLKCLHNSCTMLYFCRSWAGSSQMSCGVAGILAIVTKSGIVMTHNIKQGTRFFPGPTFTYFHSIIMNLPFPRMGLFFLSIDALMLPLSLAFDMQMSTDNPGGVCLGTAISLRAYVWHCSCTAHKCSGSAQGCSWSHGVSCLSAYFCAYFCAMPVTETY